MHHIEDYPPLAGGSQCLGFLIMVEAQALIANFVTADVNLRGAIRNKWYFQGIRVGTHSVDF